MLGSAAVAVATVVLAAPASLLFLLAVPIPFFGMRWSRTPSYIAIGGILAAAAGIALFSSQQSEQYLQRVFIQIVALTLMWEVVHAATRSEAVATAALAESEARHRLLVETLNVIPFEFDPSTRRFTYVGPQAERILGYPLEDWYAEDFWPDHLHPEDRADAVAFCEAASARGEDHEFEYRMIDVDGAFLWIHDIGAVAGERSRPTLLRGVMVDITERKHVEQQGRVLEARMLETQKLGSLGLLAGGVAHDFNNLLTTVLCNASLAIDDLPENHRVRSRIEDIGNAAERGVELTGQILAYTGQASHKTEVRDLSDVVHETLRLVTTSISKDARLELDLEEGVFARVDAGQIHQVVMNLVTNASDALGSEGGTIRVRTGVQRSDAEPGAGSVAFIEVVDDGQGMDVNTARDMFDPFFTTKPGGRGLGLAAVHGIARGHGGDVQVDSSPGTGSRLRLQIPWAEPPRREDIAVVASGQSDSPRRGAATVLVVDDEPALRLAVRGALERHGYAVLEAADGVAALDAVREHPGSVDAIVLDMTMPRLSGGETLRRLRATNRDLPVVLVSGYAEESYSDLDPSEPSRFLKKPFRAKDLARAIEALLST